MSVGYLFSGVLGHLPLLAVLITGFVLIAGRRTRLGPRSVLMARLGLGALVVGVVLEIAWSLLFPILYSRLDFSATRYGLLASGAGLVTSLVSAGGIGLLVVALVMRASGPPYGGPQGTGESFGGPPGANPQAGGPQGTGQSFGGPPGADREGGAPGAGQGFGGPAGPD